MAKRTPRAGTRRKAETASKKNIAVKKKLLLLAGKTSVGNVFSLAPDDIRVEPVRTKTPASRLITGARFRRNNIILNNQDPFDQILIFDRDSDDSIILIDQDPTDPLPPPN